MYTFTVKFCSQTIQVAANSFGNFVNNCKNELKLQENCDVIITLEDGTEVDEEYFLLLSPEDTLLVTLTGASKLLLSSFMQQLQHFIEGCMAREPNFMEEIRKLHSSGTLEDLQAFVASVPVCSEQTKLSSRHEHPHWFEGVAHRQHSKEAVLRGSAECRMRGYMQQLQKELRGMVQEMTGDKGVCCEDIEEVIFYFKQRLRKCKYHQSYFDRSSSDSESRLCDTAGWFSCAGEYNKSHCHLRHRINPYASRESRIHFSTWNLDHMIEKSRNVIPTLKHLLLTNVRANINLPYFFDLLFTKYGVCQGPDATYAATSSCNATALKDAITNYDRSFDPCHKTNGKGSYSSLTDFLNCATQNENLQQDICSKQSSRSTTAANSKNGSMTCDDYNELRKAKLSAEKVQNCSAIFTAVALSSRCITKSISGKPSHHQEASASSVNATGNIPATSVVISEQDNTTRNRATWNGNLKLVHIACHVKLPHDMMCDRRYCLLESVAATEPDQTSSLCCASVLAEQCHSVVNATNSCSDIIVTTAVTNPVGSSSSILYRSCGNDSSDDVIIHTESNNRALESEGRGEGARDDSGISAKRRVSPRNHQSKKLKSYRE